MLPARTRPVALAVALALSCTATGSTPTAALTAATAPPQDLGPLEIHHINVQQGDCTLIVGPDSTTFLIDGGKPGRGEGEIAPYLASIGVSTDDELDSLLYIHGDSDHLGGLIEAAPGFRRG